MATVNVRCRTLMTSARSLSILALLALSSCSASSPQDSPDAGAFLYATVRSVAVNVKLHEGHAPIAGARVVIRERSTNEAGDVSTGGVIFQAISGDDGWCRGTARSAFDTNDVDVTVFAPGRTGRYTDESIRQAHGPFAPAAWVQEPLTTLATLDLELNTVGGAL
jgi:hypothetical protein